MGQADRGKRWNGLTATCACAAALLLASPVAEGRRVFMNGMIGTTSVQSTEDGDAPKTNGFSVKKEDQKIIEAIRGLRAIPRQEGVGPRVHLPQQAVRQR